MLLRFGKLALASTSLLLPLLLGSCGSSTTYSASATTCTTATQGASSSIVTTTESNTIPIYIADPNTTGSVYYSNEPLVSVTICTPNHTLTTQCQTISNILLDTGSSGLRVFSSAIASNVTLTQETVNVGGLGYDLAECAEFGSASTWGPIETADIILGNLQATNIPMQVIDSSFVSSDYCTGAETDPCSAGFNGILGVGIFNYDCGSDCGLTAIGPTLPYNPRMYYGCNGTSCGNMITDSTALQIPLTSQVTNPVASLPTGYNNGLAITLPSVGVNGASQVNGTVTFGIGSTAYNVPATTVSVYPADSSGQTDGFGADFLTVFNSQSNTTYGNSTDDDGNAITAFLDSGSNALYIPSVSGLTTCSDASAFFCPTTDYSLLATIEGIDGTPTTSINFTAYNFDDLFATNNTAFNNVAGSGGETFDWGLPFFYGRTVYLGLQNQSATFNITTETGPYWAF
jgi:hypothetical protein